MTDTPTGHTADSNEPPPSVEDQRAELAETVSALAAKADVPTRVSNEAAYQASRASTAVQDHRGAAAGIVGAIVAAVVVTVVLRRRRSRKVLR